MQRNVRTFAAAAAVLILVLSIATLAAAGPPGLVRNNSSIGPPEHAQAQWENGLPPGLQGKGTPPGLVDKGGLPPGMHGREVLPPGIQMRFVNILKRLWEEKEAGLHIIGSVYIDISGDEPLTERYRAFLVDEDGNGRLVTAAAEWSLGLPDENENNNDHGQESGMQAGGDNGLDGISITQYGVLEIAADVDKTTIIIYASYTAGEGEDAEVYEASLQVELYYPEIDAVEIIGAESIELPAEDKITAEYTANVLDQHGQIMIEGAAVRWWLGDEDGEDLEDMDGISLDAGEDTSTMTTLSVTADAAAETLWLWAAYAENEDSEGSEIKGSLVITLRKMESSEDE